MFGPLANVRPNERSAAFAAFATLLAFMAGHALLETARDALFLAEIPATRLPWVYLALAGIALAVSRIGQGRPRASSPRKVATSLVVSAAGTVAFWPLIGRTGSWVLYALYVWSAVAAAVTLVEFWLLLGACFTVTQAKRIYAFIGAGSVLGAIVGTAIAGVVTALTSAAHLLVAAAACFILAAAGPPCLARFLPESPKRDPKAGSSPSGEDGVRRALSDPYALRVGAVLVVAAVVLTIVDYLFKSTVAGHLSPSLLGPFFARVYLVLNLLSLVVQLVLVRLLVRVLSVSGALVVLPSMLALGGLGLAAGGGVMAAVALKGADGTLRYSLHRTASELLYVPMRGAARSAAKTLIDVVGQRGGQALASIAILLAVRFGVDARALGAAVVVLAVGWVVLAVRLRPHYLDLFRSTLRAYALHRRFEFPQLDVSSLESMMAALNSRNDAEVVSALKLLEEEGKARVIPALVLYHPSAQVVVAALEILLRSGRDDYLPIVDRLLETGSARVRAACLRARTALAPDEKTLRAYVEDESPELRATALVGLAAEGWAGDLDPLVRLGAIVEAGSTESRRALAAAILDRPAAIFADLLIGLAGARDDDIRLVAVRAMRACPSPGFHQALLWLLTERRLRPEVRSTFVAMGTPALSFLREALEDEALPVELRGHIPRTIARFDPTDASSILLSRLATERNGAVRYKLLRALSRLCAEHRRLPIDRSVLDRLTGETVSRAFELIDWGAILEHGSAEKSERGTSAQRLLVGMIHDKEAHAIERLFLLIGLQHPGEDVDSMFRGLRNRNRQVRDSSRELIEALLDPPLRGAVLGLVSDESSQERLRQAGRYHQRLSLSYDELLKKLLEIQGESLRSLAVHHIAELRLGSLRAAIEAIEAPPDGFLAGVIERALSLMMEVPAPEGAA